jgi:hypothetical protein
MTPTVSVVLPTYNRAYVLRRAIDSVLAQQGAEIELIVVDDASTDDTRALLATIADPRLRIVHAPRNGGAARARNLGVAAARGEWLAFQDSDDEWLPGKLASQLAAARGGDFGLVLGGYEVDDGAARARVRPAAALAGGDAQLDALDGWPIITPVWLVKRALLQSLGGFPTDFVVFEDWDLVFRLLDATRATAVEGPLLVKHGSRDALCGDVRVLRDALAQMLERHGARWRDQPQRLARRLAHLGCAQFQTGHAAAARASFARATRLDPLSPAPALWLAARLGRGVNRLQRWFPRYASMAL